MDKMTSEKIANFLDFITECQELNSLARNGIAEEDKRQLDLLHAIEFENCPDKLIPLGNRLHRCRGERRVYKDLFEVTEPVVQFFQDPQHKKTLEHMRQLLGKVRKVEKYHESRVYIPRLKGGESS